MTTLFTIENRDVYLNDDQSVAWTAEAMIDDDGSGPAHGDPDEQPDTSLHVGGQPLNADIDRYIVVPQQIIQAVAPIVLGCMALVTNKSNGRQTYAVVGDVGPRNKLGEMSIACAQALGIDPSPTTGGDDVAEIVYQIWPGRAAIVGQKVYELQAT